MWVEWAPIKTLNFLNLFQQLDRMSRYDEKGDFEQRDRHQTAIVELKGTLIQTDFGQFTHESRA